MSTRDPELRRLAGQAGAYVQQARHDPHEMTLAARQAVWQKYLDRADPDRVLPPEERERRATALMKLDLTQRAYDAAKARKARERAALVDQLLEVGA